MPDSVHEPEQADQLSEMLATDDYRSTLVAEAAEPANLDDIEVGQKINDFDLMTGLGRGAFARVFLARQRSMQRLVAVKISQDKSAEPQTLAQLDHDYIVRVFDQRVLEGRRLRLLYMQYVPGGTLFTVLERVRATPAEERSGALLGDRTALDGMLLRRSGSPQSLPYGDLPPDCPAALRRALVRALDPDPDNRWPRGADMAQQFDVCLDARACDLVDPPAHSGRLRARSLMHPIMALAIAVPNALAILYSYSHNRTLIIAKLDEQAQHRFDQVALTAYGICFFIGFVVTNVLLAHLWSVSRGLRAGKPYDAATLARARTDTLQLGRRNVLTCFALWALSGIVVPVSVQLSGNQLSAEAYVHFFITQIVCGAIAMAYPYFLVTFYAVRSLYPMFLPHGGLGAEDARQLEQLDRASTYFLVVAAAVPLLGVAGATFIPPQDIPAVIIALRVLCVGSALAFVGVYWLFRMLEQDLAALQRIVSRG
ncbi:protein kinase domain-containing protein [Nocardia sp. NBC_01009]|uniref:protein kinase domain-containing protein n=1 Tax=Nocardia sp. NBC_01009 TaxID=2975996 RepID=UPI003864C315|nr:hypothetical protein OHA42_27085 [Nocardia sp. NBC_01009]